MSKHTEGAKEKNTRPNGLPESLIRYDGTAYILPIHFLIFFGALPFFLEHTIL